MTSPTRCEKLRERLGTLQQDFQRFEESFEQALHSRDFIECCSLQQEIEVWIYFLEQRLPVGRHFEVAKEIFGEDFYGQEAVEKVFGQKYSVESPPIPFTPHELVRASLRNYKLVLRVPNLDNQETDSHWTPEQLFRQFGDQYAEKRSIRLVDLNNQSSTKDLIDKESFFQQEELQPGWVLVSDSVANPIFFHAYCQQAFDQLKEELSPARLPAELQAVQDNIAQFNVHDEKFLAASRLIAERVFPKVVDLLYFKIIGLSWSAEENRFIDTIIASGDCYSGTSTKDGTPVYLREIRGQGYWFIANHTVYESIRGVILRNAPMEYPDD